MAAKGNLYQYIKDQVYTIPGVKFFDWWNENLIQEAAGTPYPTPAVFFELLRLDWDESTIGSQEKESDKTPEQYGECVFVLHIIIKKTDSRKPDAAEIAHLSVIDEVYKKIHFSGAGKIWLSGRIQRQAELNTQAHRVLRDWPTAYKCRLYECPITAIGTPELETLTPDISVNAKLAPDITIIPPGLNVELN